MGEIKAFSRWRVEGNLEEAAAVLTETSSYADWWPEAWHASELVDPGDATGLRGTSALKFRAGLAGTMRLSLRLVVDERPVSWITEVNGHLSGRTIWSLHQDGPMADIGQEWRVFVKSPLMRFMGPFGRSMFSAGHRRAMASGEAALAREIQRRRSHRGG